MVAPLGTTQRPRAAVIAGMTLVELTVALALLTVTVSCLVELLVSVNTGQQRLRHKQQAYETATQIAEDVLHSTGDWQALCDSYDARDDVEVVVQDGDDDPASGWVQIVVRVALQTVGNGRAEAAQIAFGRSDD